MTASQEPLSETPETTPKKGLGFFGADALKKLFGFGGYRPNLRTAPNALGPERGKAEEALGATLFERFGPLLPHLTVDDEGFVVLEAARPGEYEGLGFVLGFRPQTGMTEAIRKGLEGLVLAALTGTFVRQIVKSSEKEDEEIAAETKAASSADKHEKEDKA